MSSGLPWLRVLAALGILSAMFVLPMLFFWNEGRVARKRAREEHG